MASPAGVPTNFDFFFIQSSSDIDKDSAVSLGILRETSQLGAEVDAALAAEGSPLCRLSPLAMLLAPCIP